MAESNSWNGASGKIYFDMDGVLADFDRGLRELCGLEPQEQGDDAVDEMVFAAVRNVPHFFLKLEPREGMLELFGDLRSRYGDRVEVLTGVPRASRGIVDAAPDKIRWIAEHLGEDVVVHTVARREKKDYAKGCILIDDLVQNIEEWNAAGGRGILHRSTASTIEELEGILGN